MDPYFKPILLAGLTVILLNTVFILPFTWAPSLSYIIGGALAAYLFRRELSKRSGEFAELKISDVLILGTAAGVFAGGILALIIALKLQDPAAKKFIIDAINNQMKMKSTVEFERIGDLGPVFLFVMTAVTIFVCSLGTTFGALAAMPFLNPKRK